MDKWKGKVAIISGASSGIGLAILRDLAVNGIRVIGLARNCETIRKLSEELKHSGAEIYAFECDVANMESLQKSFELIEQQFSSVQILINNAGILHNASILDDSDETTEKINSVINTNIKGTVHCARKAINLMKKSNDNGIVININSIAGHSVYNGLHISNVYSPTKFAMTAFSEILRQELINTGTNNIRVSNLSPGVVRTEIMVRGQIFKSQDDYDKVAHIHSEDISQGVLYLLSTPCNVNVTQLTIKPVGEKK